MTTQNGTDAQGQRSVLDEENFVDKKRKEQILRRREEIDADESELFSAAKMGQISMHEAASLWHDSVRRYLTSFEPLLRRPELPDSQHYYHDVELGEVVLSPPEQFLADDDRPENGVTRGNGLLEADAPEAVAYPVRGIKTVIERDQFEHQWSFRVDMREVTQGPFSGKPIQVLDVADSQPLGAGILRNAVRAGDEFLENAGVGMDLGTPEVDVEAEPF